MSSAAILGIVVAIVSSTSVGLAVLAWTRHNRRARTDRAYKQGYADGQDAAFERGIARSQETTRTLRLALEDGWLTCTEALTDLARLHTGPLAEHIERTRAAGGPYEVVLFADVSGDDEGATLPRAWRDEIGPWTEAAENTPANRRVAIDGLCKGPSKELFIFRVRYSEAKAAFESSIVCPVPAMAGLDLHDVLEAWGKAVVADERRPVTRRFARPELGLRLTVDVQNGRVTIDEGQSPREADGGQPERSI